MDEGYNYPLKLNQLLKKHNDDKAKVIEILKQE